MPLADHAPIAPFAAVEKVIETYRDTGLGGRPITEDLLVKMSVGQSVASRVVQALQMLGLVDDSGTPTDTLVAFKKAPSESYREILLEAVRETYEPVFAIIGYEDLSAKSSTEIEDAFRHFRPDSLRPRMVTLFLNLCAYVGIYQPKVERNAPAPSSRPSPSKKTPSAKGSRTNHSKGRGQSGETPARPDSSVFAISDADLAGLSDDEFNTVWGALGMLARSRARAKTAPVSDNEEDV